MPQQKKIASKNCISNSWNSKIAFGEPGSRFPKVFLPWGTEVDRTCSLFSQSLMTPLVYRRLLEEVVTSSQVLTFHDQDQDQDFQSFIELVDQWQISQMDILVSKRNHCHFHL